MEGGVPVAITDLADKRPDELQVLSKAQLIAAILEGQTDTEREQSVDGPHGQVLRQHVVRDRATGAVIKRVRTEWTYRPNGDVDEIVTVERDKDGKQKGRQMVKHHQDGRVEAS